MHVGLTLLCQVEKARSLVGEVSAACSWEAAHRPTRDRLVSPHCAQSAMVDDGQDDEYYYLSRLATGDCLESPESN